MSFTGTLDKCKAYDKLFMSSIYCLQMVSLTIGLASNAATAMEFLRLAITPPWMGSSTASLILSNFLRRLGVSIRTFKVVSVEGEFYHKACFKCSHGGCSITPSSYAALDGILYCKPHFAQLFKEKGSYQHLIKTATMKRNAAEEPAEEEDKPTVDHPTPEPVPQPEQEQT